MRANERFGGRGHRIHICRDCQRLPRSELDRIERLDELRGFLDQSNISERNRESLKLLAAHESPEVRTLAALVEDVARVHPRRRRRFSNLARNHPDLLKRMISILGDEWWDEVSVRFIGSNTDDFDEFYSLPQPDQGIDSE
ncbi:MAG TPA: hypothetical protein DCE44_21310 [Verrucomicrobiales bacterium]|nr:hypothetical protein [Verrucomicrobiales bacterium]